MVISTSTSTRSIFLGLVLSSLVWGSACSGNGPTPPPPAGDGGPTDGSSLPPCSAGAGTGAVPGIDSCVLTSVHVCQNDFCHGAKTPSADLMLTEEFLVGPSVKLLLDKPNVGKPGVTSTMDPSGCPPAFGKIIDSSNPEKSLVYTKTGRPQACGAPMPVIGTFGTADRACVLRWIESVISTCGGTSDAGGG